ncbi:MAG: DUF4276 family protein [Acidobacteriota bacterium]
MKPLIIVVEGDTEEEFVKDLLLPYFHGHEIYDVRPIKISTKAGFKGGFVNYDHLKRDVTRYLKEHKTRIVTTFVDYFRLPNSVPKYSECQQIHFIDARIECLENSISETFQTDRFIPYIQKHEFEALLFSSNAGFESYFENIAKETQKIINQYPNPEDINDQPHTAPSKRLLALNYSYDKVNDGNIIALEIGLETILEKCPRFRNWIETIIEKVKS